MKIGIAGATGVLGRVVIPLLIQDGHQVRILARTTAKARTLFPAEVEIVEGDLLDADVDLAALLKGCDGAAHLATSIPQMKDMGKPGVWDVNTRLRIEGTKRLLQASFDAGVRRYIQQSIVMAYADHGDEWITEDTPFDTDSDVVRNMEGMVQDTPTERLEWCILRGGLFLGKDTAQEETIHQLRGGQLRVAGDGRNFISPIHPADMASAVVAAFVKAPPESVFNINDEPLREGDYLDRLAEFLDIPKPLRDLDKPSPPSYRCSNQAAKTALGWSPKHSIFP
jgi:nucleoside-diphosphate-sugar epimerase